MAWEDEEARGASPAYFHKPVVALLVRIQVRMQLLAQEPVLLLDLVPWSSSLETESLVSIIHMFGLYTWNLSGVPSSGLSPW